MRTGHVFLSHTSDMAQFPQGRSFVQAALEAVARAHMVAVDMRYFAAQDGRRADYCRERVRECDVFVAVMGFRYGSLVPGESLSYTDLEFQTATQAGLPRLVFLLEETACLPGAADVDPGPVTGFRDRLRNAGLAADLRALGFFKEALDSNRETYDRFKEQFGPDTERALAAAHNLACSLRLVGDYFAARELDSETLDRQQRVLPPNHPHTLLSAASLALNMRAVGTFRDSVDLLRETWKQYREVLGAR